MQIESILNRSLVEGTGKVFYTFSNTEGKQWIMPAKHMQTAMCLYQPSGIKGKGMKLLFPYFHWVGIVNKMLRAERKRYELMPELNSLLCQLFKSNNIEFSIFCGTPCVHQKITMQISKGTRILGYVKFSNNHEISHMFQREKETLDYLEKKGVKCVPQCLYYREWINGITLFVQNTTKTRYSSTAHYWGIRETKFIKELHKKTKLQMLFENTDYYQDLQFLSENINSLQGLDIKSVVNGISNILNVYANKEVTFSLYHADFTPWNIYIEKGFLHAFDFEYAKHSYPPYLDYFHFFTQTAIFEKHLDADGIWKLFQQHKKDIDTLLSSNQMDFAYLCYLLGNITHYIKRENGIYSKSMIDYFKVYIYLIQQLLSQNI